MNLVEFWDSVLRRLRCVVCARFEATGEPPALHHVAEGSGIRSEFAKVPLCYTHHQGALGLHGMGPKAFIRMFRPPGDTEAGLIVWTNEDLAKLMRLRAMHATEAPISQNDKRWRFLEHGCQWVSFIPTNGDQHSFDPRVVSKAPGVGLVHMREVADREMEKQLGILRAGISDMRVPKP